MKKHFKGAIAILLLSTVIVILATGCASKVDLAPFCDVTYSGYNTKGSAQLNVNWAEFESVILGGKEAKQEDLAKILALESSIKYKLDKTESLSNGDKINVSISWNEEIAKKYKYSFSPEKMTFTVSGLPEAQKVDIFEGVGINFSGVSPRATAEITNGSDLPFAQTSVRYSLDKFRDIKNGDVITMKAEFDQSYAEKQMLIIEKTDKQFVAEGIDAYITKYQEIDAETLKKATQQSLDLIEAELAQQYKASSLLYPGEYFWSYDFNKLVVKDIKLTESYFFVLKEGLEPGWSDVENSIFLVFTVNYSDEINPDGRTVYVPVYFKNFINRAGKIDVVITDAVIVDPKTDNHDNLYRDIVIANKDKYTYEEIKY